MVYSGLQLGSGTRQLVLLYMLFRNKLRGMAVTPNESVPILNKHLKGYIPDGRQLGIASNEFPGGIDQFTEVKVIHIGTVQYMRPGDRDNQRGSTTVNNTSNTRNA